MATGHIVVLIFEVNRKKILYILYKNKQKQALAYASFISPILFYLHVRIGVDPFLNA